MRGLWLIDGAYLYKSGRRFQHEHPEYATMGIDYKKLKDRLRSEYGIDDLDTWYFNATPNPVEDGRNGFYSWLKSTEPKGPNMRVKLYALKDKHVYCRACNEHFSIKVQKGVDVGLATTALRLYPRYDVIILSAGDGDFEDFIRYLVEEQDKKLYIVGFDRSISPDLQQYSTNNFLLNEHYEEICDSRSYSEEILEEEL